jgi:DNA-binding response OmpR family regulator
MNDAAEVIESIVEAADRAILADAPKCPCCRQPVGTDAFLIDDLTSTITRGDRSARFTPLEMKLVRILLDHMPSVAPKQAIYNALYGDREPIDWPEPKIIDVVVCKTRKDLNRLGLVVETIWGRGYRLHFAEPHAGVEVEKGVAA